MIDSAPRKSMRDLVEELGDRVAEKRRHIAWQLFISSVMLALSTKTPLAVTRSFMRLPQGISLLGTNLLMDYFLFFISLWISTKFF